MSGFCVYCHVYCHAYPIKLFCVTDGLQLWSSCRSERHGVTRVDGRKPVSGSGSWGSNLSPRAWG